MLPGEKAQQKALECGTGTAGRLRSELLGSRPALANEECLPPLPLMQPFHASLGMMFSVCTKP
jgi:hypothetical protein